MDGTTELLEGAGLRTVRTYGQKPAVVTFIALTRAKQIGPTARAA